MNIEYIKEFIILAENKNYNETAEKMFVSQSTLFKHIKALENELGVTLFQKTGRKIEITSYGTRFLQRAVEISRIWDECMLEANMAKDAETSLIRIGTEYQVQDLVNEFYNLDLGYRILSNGSGCRRRITDRKCDLAILTTGLESDYEKKKFENFDHRFLMNETLVVVVNRHHPFARRKSVAVEELFQETFVDMQNSSDGEYDLAGRLFRQYHKLPMYSRSASSSSEAVAQVLQNHGLVIMHGKYFELKDNYTDDIRVIPIDYPGPIEVSIWWPKDVKLSKASRIFIDFAADYYKKFAEEFNTTASADKSES